MYVCYYLLVWLEDSACWWQADECEAFDWASARRTLRNRNPSVTRCYDNWAVVHHDDLPEALCRRPDCLSLDTAEARTALAVA